MSDLMTTAICNWLQATADDAMGMEPGDRHMANEAKKLLEAKDMRIAELERGWESIESEEVAEMRRLDAEKSARIAELEGDLEVMRLQRDAKRWTRESHDN